MLKEIKSEVFSEKRIAFHKGLNVILGDDDGSNSIGKSNLLMIIDFIFGGNTYISHNIDVVDNLGQHEFYYSFDFNGEKLFFCRGTEEPKYVYKCNKYYKKETKLKLDEFNKLLARYYDLDWLPLTFRSIVSLYSRVWGKGNSDVKKPLHTVSNEKLIEAVTRLIKLFDEYEPIAKEDKIIKSLDEAKKLRDKAGKLQVIPRINKRTYESNEKEIQGLLEEIEQLSKSLYSPIINVSEMISDEVLELRERKKLILNQIEYNKSRLSRINTTINKSVNIKFEGLKEFFPEINLKKLSEIEEFHDGISTILSNQFKSARKELAQKIRILGSELEEINEKLERTLNPNREPNVFVDNLIETSSRLKNMQLQNKHYKELKNLKESIDGKKAALEKVKEGIVEKISGRINEEIRDIYTQVYDKRRNPPVFELKPNKYDYKYTDNTGTGNAYVNLIVFDLAIFRLTKLPYISHDSFLFKNIEQKAIENLINIYDTFNRQVFIAIDVTNIYSKEIQEIIIGNSVIKLAKDKLLFTKDWRVNGN